MKKTLTFAAAGLVLASATVYAVAQMHQHGPGPGAMQERMQERMKGPHGPMPQGGMKHGGGHGPGGHGSSGHGPGGHDHGAAPVRGDTGPASQAFRAINDKMHRGMDIAFTGNADVDFVTGMIPHHEGAVEMAKVVIAFGKDPEIRKLAEEVVRAQEGEIALMKAWLARNRK